MPFIEIDTAANTVKTRFYGPWNKQEWPEFARTVRGMAWVG